MPSYKIIKLSKYLCLLLRHKPDKIGIELEERGWANVAELLENMNKAGTNIDLNLLIQVVATDNKNRFSFNDKMEKIRANQGHSIKIDLGYEAQQPPELLYHGTATRLVKPIFQNGLDKRKRHHVHLSLDIETAIKVGERHGEAYVFKVFAGKMFKEGFEFFLSENGVWLTDNVPKEHLKPVE